MSDKEALDYLAGLANDYDLTSLSVSPNPFNAKTVISFELRVASDVSLKVYDITGREVVTLDTRHLTLGMNSVVWDAKDNASGVYFVRLRVDSGQSMVRKILLVK